MKIVDTSGFGWLNFELTLADKFKLFARGVLAAQEFLCGGGNSRTGFDWLDYKRVRMGCVDAR